MSNPVPVDIIQQELDSLSGWEFIDNKLVKVFKAKGFRDAIAALVRLSYECEELDHHPEIHNVYNTTRISLTTHDAGDLVTEKDLLLARKIDEIM